MGYGGFVRGKNVAVGEEYVEADPFAEEDEEAAPVEEQGAAAADEDEM
jgi:hypothetical protein